MALPAPYNGRMMPNDGTARKPGLRERKKARTRAAIREHAFRLMREQGYAEPEHSTKFHFESVAYS